MAHSTDYYSQQDLSNLRKSSQPKMQPQTPHEICSQFLIKHSHWSIDSIVLYLTKTYHNDGVSKKIISSCINDYIMEK